MYEPSYAFSVQTEFNCINIQVNLRAVQLRLAIYYNILQSNVCHLSKLDVDTRNY